MHVSLITEAIMHSYKHLTCVGRLIYNAFPFVPGPISSILVNTYGCRPIIMMGGCLCFAGMILASFCNSVVQLYLCIGVIGGKSI